VLQTLGCGAALSGVVSGASGLAAASHTDKDSAEDVRPLSDKETGELRGTVMSSSSFKTVRQKIQRLEFWPELGSDVMAIEVEKEDGQTYKVFKTVCEYTGDDSDDADHDAVLYSVVDGDKITTRSMCHHEGEPIHAYIHTCSVDDRSGAEDEPTHQIIPVNDGGD
jgi:hypothetical protein